jgi:hypothetical protein
MYNGTLTTVAWEFSCTVHMANTSSYSIEECWVASVWVHKRQGTGQHHDANALTRHRGHGGASI